MNNFVKGIGGMFAVLSMYALRSAALCFIWKWFVVATTELGQIPFWPMFGIVAMYGTISIKKDGDEDDFNGDILIWWLSLAGEILLRLAVLWIVKIIFI